jgi:tetratricopeptide (TPR) repeat protein
VQPPRRPNAPPALAPSPRPRGSTPPANTGPRSAGANAVADGTGSRTIAAPARPDSDAGTARGSATHKIDPRAAAAARARTSTSRQVPIGPEAVRLMILSSLQRLEAGVDHFTLLGVQQGASPEQIQTSYLDLAHQLHPGRIRALHLEDVADEAHRLFAQINTAFAVLSNPKRRADYVNALNAGRGEQGGMEARSGQPEPLTQADRRQRAAEQFHRGEMWLRRSRFSEALGEFRQATELDPSDGDHLAGYAWAMWCHADNKAVVAAEVKRSLNRAIDLAPNSAAPRIYRGRIAKQEGKDELALQYFEQALEVAPGNLDAEAEVQVLEARIAKAQKASTSQSHRFKR